LFNYQNFIPRFRSAQLNFHI